jgi:outer membrane receptor protein involved in Fe transport
MSIDNRLDLRFGVNNIFDRDPPIVDNANLPGIIGNGNTFPQVYDFAGRYIFAGASVRF